uniref:Uncharacterized protein n=1 Tax=Leptobrachium leishanense TaxID=445787 RepID=A0A8C5M9S6_9ANUR
MKPRGGKRGAARDLTGPGRSITMIYRRRILKGLLYFLMFFVSCAVIYNSYTKKQRRAPYCLGTNEEPPPLPADTCRNIKNIITISQIKKIKSDELRKHVKDLQRCPWSRNASALMAIRSELQACCDAARYFLVTQENTQIGDNITYETQKSRQIVVTETLHKMFPKTSVFNKPIRSCAVVGNGGILRNSCCGAEIDRADYVFRFNLPPMNYSDDTGRKTNLVTANPSIVSKRYSRLHERRRPFMDLVKTFEPAPILMAAFSYPGTTDVTFKVFYTLDEFGSQQKVVYYHPNYLTNLAVYWKENGIAVRRLSSGFMIVSTALEICDKVTLYGFWPFDQDTNGKPILHHYYDNMPPKRGAHSMPDEFFYTQMHSKGIVKLQVEKCF